jgi:hypothetical protein
MCVRVFLRVCVFVWVWVWARACVFVLGGGEGGRETAADDFRGVEQRSWYRVFQHCHMEYGNMVKLGFRCKV